MIAIVDYGMANLRSVQKAFEQTGHRADIVSDPSALPNYDKIVLPGVGAFKDAISTLRSTSLDQPILDHIHAGKPFLGICLGLQMLFDVGYEDGIHQGLKVLRGQCVRFTVDQTHHLKVPHMGWNQLHQQQSDNPLYRDLPPDAAVYFVHSYHVVPTDPTVIATTTDYGQPFVSSIHKDNIHATQFHPEKSQKVGLQILSNFAEL